MTTSALLPVAALPPAPVPMKPHAAGVKPIPGYDKYFTYLRKHLRFTPRKSTVHFSQFPAGTFSPLQVCAAYGWQKLTPARTCKIGIVSLSGTCGDDDMAAFCSAQNPPLPVPTITRITAGGAVAVSDPQGSNVENDLDCQMSYASWYASTGVTCEIVFCSAPNSDDGIPLAVAALDAYGCEVISCSWGSPDVAGSGRDACEAQLAITCGQRGKTFVAASGDNSKFDGTRTATDDYPSGSAWAIAVGGTTLTVNANGTRVSEAAWGDGKPGDEGGGGGYDVLTPVPAWQSGIVPTASGNYRCTPDWALNADPDTGYQICSGSQWQVVGGTSASAPLSAGYIAAIKASTTQMFGMLGPIVYPARATAFFDIILGSNGWPTEPGYDLATGNGSINGGPFAAEILASVNVPITITTGTTAPPVTPPTGTAPPPVVQPPPVVIPPPVTPPAGAGIGVVQFRQLMRWVQVMLLESQGQLETTVRSVIAGLPLSPQQLATVNTVIASVLASIGARRGLGSPGALPKATYAAVSADDFSPLVEFFGAK